MIELNNIGSIKTTTVFERNAQCYGLEVIQVGELSSSCDITVLDNES